MKKVFKKFIRSIRNLKFRSNDLYLFSNEEKLPPLKFMRIHRSYIVALNKIDFIEEGVININGAAIPVADAYKAALNSRLNLL